MSCILDKYLLDDYADFDTRLYFSLLSISLYLRLNTNRIYIFLNNLSFEYARYLGSLLIHQQKPKKIAKIVKTIFFDISKWKYSTNITRWKRLLWGSHPLLSPNIVDEYNSIVSDVKSQCECKDDRDYRDDIDVKLCVLAVNRLRNNLDVFRGERIGLPALGTTVVTYKPNLLEPLGCRTMVQVLERKSERYEGTSYAYFEPEDVMLVGFYDFRPTRLRSSFSFTVPQRPVHVNDYFGLFHGPKGCKADRFYAMDSPRWWWCPTYKEDMERIRFRDNDRLTVSKRKWRFEPGTVCLTYKSCSERQSYEIVRHVTIGGENDNEDNDRFRICTSAGDEYYIEVIGNKVLGYCLITVFGERCLKRKKMSR